MSLGAKERVLVVGPRPWDVEELGRDLYRDRFEFIFRKMEFYETPLPLIGFRFRILQHIEKLVKEARSRDVQGVMGTHDYPASLVAAAVAERLRLPGPKMENILVCSHKYLARQMQRRTVPEATPDFSLINPFDDSRERIHLPFPFFVKPAKGTMSIRASQVKNPADLEKALAFSWIEKTVGKMAMKPFSQLLNAYTSHNLSGCDFIAEEVLSGHQVTVDGYVFKGRVVIMGIVDSIMYPGTISFQRFEYPSRLAPQIQRRMADICNRVMEASGFDNSCFNVELMYNPLNEAIHIIEINPRMSCQFGDLYERVDGKHTYEIQLDLATGKDPGFTPGRGRDQVAASFVLRTFKDKKVRQVPSRQSLEAVARRFPGTLVTLLCRPGRKLSSLPQDVGSFRYAYINAGAANRRELFENFEEIQKLLPFDFADV